MPVYWRNASITAHNGNITLAFLRRNLKDSIEKLKELAYFTLITSVLKHSVPIWDHHKVKDSNKLPRVQRRAAQFVKKDYRYMNIVSNMKRPSPKTEGLAFCSLLQDCLPKLIPEHLSKTHSSTERFVQTHMLTRLPSFPEPSQPTPSSLNLCHRHQASSLSSLGWHCFGTKSTSEHPHQRHTLMEVC